jgi:hypothetical protein
MSPRKLDNLLQETADLLTPKAAELPKQVAGRPKEEAEELMSAAMGLTRLYERMIARAYRRWKKERELNPPPEARQ